MEILIIDDHSLFREGLYHVLHQMEGNVSIHETFDCDRALEYAAEHPNLGLVLLDLNMLGKGGVEVLDIFSQCYHALPIVMLSASSFQQNVTRALDKGAAGFIDKNAVSKAMLDALHIVLDGGIYVPPNIASQQQLDQQIKTNDCQLTPRQLQVLQSLVVRSPNKGIAFDLSLSEVTAKMHVTAIFKRLNVTNRSQAALLAVKNYLN